METATVLFFRSLSCALSVLRKSTIETEKLLLNTHNLILFCVCDTRWKFIRPETQKENKSQSKPSHSHCTPDIAFDKFSKNYTQQLSLTMHRVHFHLCICIKHQKHKLKMYCYLL